MVDCDCYSYPCEHNPRGMDLAESKPNGEPLAPRDPSASGEPGGGTTP